jgi:hypothetical protein
MLLLPGTKNRIGLTHPGIIKDFSFFLEGIKYLFLNIFIYKNIFFGYFSIFILGRLISGRNININSGRTIIITLFFGIFAVFLFSVLLYYNSNGHFPTRLISNFVGIYLGILILGFLVPAKTGFPSKNIISLIFIGLIFMLSPNFKTALEDIFLKDALGFRAYKLAVFKEINNCKSDTCEVPYKNYNLKIIPDQEFIFPGEPGFPVKHKIFIARYFGKDYIRYKPATLPPELRNEK